MDTTTIVLERVEINVEENTITCKGRGSGCLLNISSSCPVFTVGLEEWSYTNVTHQNHSEFGLPTYPFRFENVNRMANTVAGVLSMDGETPSILGARREGTAYYINEVRVLEGFLPETLE